MADDSKATDVSEVIDDGPTSRAGPPLAYKVRLLTADDVRVEMARVYRDARFGRIAISDGTKLVYMLAQIGRVIESADLERRLEHLEEALERNG